MYYVKIEGVKYKVENGVYDPPLPEDRVAKDKDNFDEICRTRQCPGLRTDTNFHAGRGTILDQMDGDPQWTQHLVNQALKQGYNPGINDVYLGQLADRTGDPDAWFKPGEGRSELIKRAKKKGKGVEAPGVSVEARPYQEKQGPQLNPVVTKRLMNTYRASGEASGKCDRELKDFVVKKHGRAI